MDCLWFNILMHTPMKPNSMKHSLLVILCVFSLFPDSGSCNPGAGNNGDSNPHPTGNKMRIKIGTKTFPATLYDNATAAAFKSLLPMTVKMVELNGNEKYFDLSGNLLTNESYPRTIQSGDLMMYGSNTLVLFYKTFPTSYSYTKLGRINDPEGLAAAVGSGNVTVTYDWSNGINFIDRRTSPANAACVWFPAIGRSGGVALFFRKNALGRAGSREKGRRQCRRQIPCSNLFRPHTTT